MSASQIKQFIQEVSAHFGAPADELEAMWDTLTKYAKMKKAELVKECTEKKLAITGTKQDLINRLQGKPETEAPKKPKKTARKKKTIPVDSLSSIRTHLLKKNSNDQWVHEPTGFILHAKKKNNAYARIVGGVERSLVVEDIPDCKEYGFDWIL